MSQSSREETRDRKSLRYRFGRFFWTTKGSFARRSLGTADASAFIRVAIASRVVSVLRAEEQPDLSSLQPTLF